MTTPPRSNVAVLRELYAAINRRDFSTGFALVDDEFEWEVPERALLSGTYRGRAAVTSVLESQLDAFDEFEIQPEEFFEAGDRVVVFVRQRARGAASGVQIEIRIGHLWTLRDGTPIRLEVFPERELALDAADIAPRSG